MAAFLTSWWRGIEPAAQFVRTPLSGGWATPQLRGGFRASGDIMTTSPTFPFVVEVKRRERFDWDTFLKGRKSPVWGWWQQSCRSADEQDGTPMLWLRHNQEPWRVVLPADSHAAHLVSRLVSSRFVVRFRLEPGEKARKHFPDLPPVCVLAANAVLAVPPSAFLP